MDELRRPLFFVALALLGLVLLVELGATGLLGQVAVTPAQIQELIADSPDLARLSDRERADLQRELTGLGDEAPPGLAIGYLALLDGVLLFAVALIGLGLVLPGRVQGRAQGVATLVFAILVILGAIGLIVVAIGLLSLMLALLLAVPFGTITYLAIYGFFDRGGASVALSLIMLLKLGFAICLLLAQQRFLQNKGLVLMIVTSLAATALIAILHGIVPGTLVSVTDALAAIVVGIAAAIWAAVLLLGSVVSIGKALRPSA